MARVGKFEEERFSIIEGVLDEPLSVIEAHAFVSDGSMIKIPVGKQRNEPLFEKKWRISTRKQSRSAKRNVESEGPRFDANHFQEEASIGKIIDGVVDVNGTTRRMENPDGTEMVVGFRFGHDELCPCRNSHVYVRLEQAQMVHYVLPRYFRLASDVTRRTIPLYGFH